MNYITALTSANSMNQAMRKQFDASISSARQEVAEHAAALSSNIQTLTQANLGLVNTLNERRTGLQQLQEMQAKLLEVVPAQDEEIQDLTEEVQKLQVATQKSQAQFDQFKDLLEQTKQATAGSTAAIETMKKDLSRAHAREVETQSKFEELKGEFLGLHEAFQSSGNDRIKLLQELQVQNVFLSRFLAQFEFVNEADE